MLSNRLPRLTFLILAITLGAASARAGEPTPLRTPLIVGHRGLLRDAPENTLANFRACLDLRLGFEVDVRRTQDGHLVCVHDDTVDRTTNGHGAVAAMTLGAMQNLDAGAWFGAAFRGERIPTFDEVLAVVEKQKPFPFLIAIDLKAADIEADTVRIAKRHGVLDTLLFIGNAIGTADVRRKLRQADAAAHVACLAGVPGEFDAAVADKHADWVYFRYIPTCDEIERVHKAGKRAFLSGPLVTGLERENWRKGMQAGVDAILTDFAFDLARDIRSAAKVAAPAGIQQEKSMDQRFTQLAARFVGEYPAISPVGATSLGDHRFDDKLDEISEASRQRQREFCLRYQKDLGQIVHQLLSRENQIDYQLLAHHLKSELWSLDRLQEWAWNPLVYTQLAGGAIYGLMSREFAPLEKRLLSVAARLEQYPRFYAQVRSTLVAKRVPPVHVETAIKQNRGVLSTIDNMVRPHLEKLSEGDRGRLVKAIALATAEVDRQQQWLEKELLPNAKGDARLGTALYDEKLAFTLGASLTRQELRERAEFELRRVRTEMYGIARKLQQEQKPSETPPEAPTPEVQQTVIAAALERANIDVPPRDGVVAAARRSMEIATEFVRRRDLVTVPPDPLEIIIMPEFQRGVSVAYCDSPGPLEVGQKTFYAVAPLPDDWSNTQCASFLREYNLRSIHNLTVHEAMPGHFLQLAHANRHPDRLRALLSSGVFVEGWACYTEQLLTEEGFLDRDPLMRLISLKWYLRSIANTILDQSVHVDGIRREEAMKLMMHDTFQEEREAAGKWTRAQLTSAQLSTYFIGYQEHRDLRAAAKSAWGSGFSLKRYHDGVLSFGSPPPRFVRVLLLNEPVPER